MGQHLHVPPTHDFYILTKDCNGDEKCIKKTEYYHKFLLSIGLFTLFVIIVAICGSIKKQNDKIEQQKVNHQSMMILPPIVVTPQPNWYDSAITHIKEYEGFRATVYNDNDGSPTIGYGHHLRKGENFTLITKQQGDSILRADFDRYLKSVQKHYTLEDNEEIAVTLFTYNVGLTRFDNSRLSDWVETRDPRLEREWLRFRHAEIDGVITELRRLKERREYEIQILNWEKKTQWNKREWHKSLPI